MTTPIRMLDVKPQASQGNSSSRHPFRQPLVRLELRCREPFRSMNSDLWEDTRENPVEFLCRLKQEELKSLAGDQGFRAHLDRVKREFDRYMSERPDPKWFGPWESPSRSPTSPPSAVLQTACPSIPEASAFLQATI
jgi:hypothetical protein